MVSRSLISLLIIWPMAGYPLLTVLTYALDWENSAFSLAIRGLVGACAVVLLFLVKRGRMDVNIHLLVVFSLMYAFQLVLTIYLRKEPTELDHSLYWAWAFGACILPAIATYYGSKVIDYAAVFRWLLVATLLTTGLMLIFGSTINYESGLTGADIGRWNIPALNPIAMGHLGATCFLLGIGALLSFSHQKSWRKALAFGAILLGGILLILANSRGPFVALGVVMFMLFFARFNQRANLSLLALLSAGVAYLLFTRPEILTDSLISRFTAMSSGNDVSSELRLLAFAGAWEQFLSSPIVGDGIEERVTGFYPHNVILEALMATGLLGAIPFIVLLSKSLWASWKILRKNPDLIWLALLSVQYIVGAQMSGAIYQTPSMWICMAAILGASNRKMRAPARYRRHGRAPEVRLQGSPTNSVTT